MDWNNVTYLDLFSGVGGFAYGFQQAGMKFKHHYFSEIDKHSIAVYKYHYEEAEPVGNITTFSGDTIERPNLITFGFPCQDLSIAGKQAGLAGSRSGLFFQALRLVERFKPEVFIFENVAGLLSSNEGKDFEIVLRAIADIGLYECEWQLVNTRWVLPQNRERVYFVGCLGGAGRARVFPFRENDTEFIKPQREASGDGERVWGEHSSTISARYYKDGSECLIDSGATLMIDPDHKKDGLRIYNEECSTLRGRDWKEQKCVVIQKTSGQCVTEKINETGTLQADGANVMDKVPNVIISHYGHKNKPPVESEDVPTLKAQSHGHEPMIIQKSQDYREDGSLRTFDDCPTIRANMGDTAPMVVQVNPSLESGGQQPYQQNRVYDSEGISPALHSLSERINIQIKELDHKYRVHRNDEKKSEIQGASVFKEDCGCMDIIDNHPKLIITGNLNNGHEAGNVYSPNGLAPTVRDNHGKVTAIDMKTAGGKSATRRGGFKEEETPTLDGNCNLAVANTVTPDAYLARGERNRDENGNAVLTSMNERRIRRLTPVECERLQGFPDNWTALGNYDGIVKPVPKTQRYRQMGNAVTTLWPQLIAQRLIHG